MTRPRLLLSSSNARRQYTEDVLTALALPPGSIIQFRYGANYVAPELQREVADRSIVGSEAVLAFIADQEGEDRPFLLPVRFARVSSATVSWDTFFFRLCVGDYPNLAGYPLKEDELRAASAVRVDRMTARTSGKFYSATIDCPDLDLRDNGSPADRWGDVVRRLLLSDTFRNSFFMKVDPPLSQSGRPLTFSDEGRLELVDQRSARIPVSFYSEQYRPEDGYTLSCRTDGTFLRVSSDEAHDIALRYDAVEFWIHPTVNTFDTLAGVTLAMAPQSRETSDVDDAPVPAYARLPVLVKRSRSRLATRAVIGGSGAVLVALPAILGPGTPLALRILLAALGAILFAVPGVILGSSGR